MKTVYVDIVGDLFHYGHVRFFKQALENGDRLIVGVMSDEECEKYKRKPILNIEERCESIRACKYVHLVIPNAPMPITKLFMERYNIDVVCHGDDMSKQDISHWYIEPIKQGKYVSTKYTKSISTSDIIKRCKSV